MPLGESLVKRLVNHLPGGVTSYVNDRPCDVPQSMYSDTVRKLGPLMPVKRHFWWHGWYDWVWEWTDLLNCHSTCLLYCYCCFKARMSIYDGNSKKIIICIVYSKFSLKIINLLISIVVYCCFRPLGQRIWHHPACTVQRSTFQILHSYFLGYQCFRFENLSLV